MRIEKGHFLLNKPIAHRGLWGNFNGTDIVENSVPAFENAVKNGYPIEIDVFASVDGVLFCFHDDSLKRMTGKDALIFECDSKTLKGLTLDNSTCGIPTLKQVLDICKGKVPLLIEIKNQPRKDIVDLVVSELNGYKGEYAIQSFNPKCLMRLKKKAPNVLRGVLGSDQEKNQSRFTNFIISKMPLNFLVKPDFISYNFLGLNYAKKRINVPLLAWTVTDKKTQNEIKDKCDNIIFEGFLPEKVK